jgi:phosphoribosylpyrophosphate synthetase
MLKKSGGERIFSMVYHDLNKGGSRDNIEHSKLKEIAILNTIDPHNNFSEKLIKLNISSVISKYLGEIIDY